MPFTDALVNAYHVGLADGPTEVHKVTVAREVLKDFTPVNTMFPDYMRCKKEEAALAYYRDALAAVA